MIDFALPTALYGGSFDPVHEGHLHVARSVLGAIPEIRQIVFVPAGQSPGKKSVAPADLRLAWLKLALGQEFGVWDFELRSAGESFTVHTLEEARRLGAKPERLYWIMGGDAYSAFPSWKDPARIRELARLIVVNRGERPIAPQDARDILVSIPPHPASSTEIRAQLASGEASSPWISPRLRAEFDKILPAQNPYVKN